MFEYEETRKDLSSIVGWVTVGEWLLQTSNGCYWWMSSQLSLHMTFIGLFNSGFCHNGSFVSKRVDYRMPFSPTLLLSQLIVVFRSLCWTKFFFPMEISNGIICKYLFLSDIIRFISYFMQMPLFIGYELKIKARRGFNHTK